MTPAGLVRWVHEVTYQKYEADVALYGLEHGSKMERFTFYLIWPYVVMVLLSMLSIATMLGVLAWHVWALVWRLILTY